jgi:hypothetical protein
MATPPPSNLTPPPTVVITLRLRPAAPHGRRPRPHTNRRPPRELPPVSPLQRWLDLSG